jgi:ankyrin repeat protein
LYNLSVQALISSGGGQYGTALQATSHSGDLESVKFLLKSGADPNIQGERTSELSVGVELKFLYGGGEYGTALQAASHSGHLEIVKVLRASGADPNIRGERA